MRKAIGYIRVSTDRQDFERQRNEIVEYAKKNDFLITKFFEDKQSGSDYDDRKGFQELLLYLDENPQIKIIIFDEISRMGRDTALQVATYKALSKKGVRVYTRGKGEFGTNKEDGLLFTVLSAISDYEKQTIIDRTSSGRRKVVKDGFTQTSQAPYGYNLVLTKKKNDRVIKRQTIEINQEEADVVKDIFKIVENGGSSYEVLRYLNSQNIRSPRGKKWCKSTVLNILHNTTYYGEWLFGKYVKNGKTKYSMSKRPKKDLLLVQVPAIITKEQFDKVQKNLKLRRFEFNPKNLKKVFLLQGLFKCQCGHSLQCISENKAGFRIYRCPERNIKGVSKKTCPISSIKADFIERILLQEIKAKIEDTSFLKEAKLKKLDNLTKPIKDLEKRKLLIEKQYISDNEKLKKYYEKSISLLESNPEKAFVFENLADELMESIRKNKTLLIDLDEKIRKKTSENIDFDLFKDIKKALKYIKKKDLEEFKFDNKKLDFVRSYIKNINIKILKKDTNKIRKEILSLKKGIFSKKNKSIRDLYFTVANKNNDIKKGALVVFELKIEFVNNYTMKIKLPYFHKNPDITRSYLKEESVEIIN